MLRNGGSNSIYYVLKAVYKFDRDKPSAITTTQRGNNFQNNLNSLDVKPHVTPIFYYLIN